MIMLLCRYVASVNQALVAVAVVVSLFCFYGGLYKGTHTYTQKANNKTCKLNLYYISIIFVLTLTLGLLNFLESAAKETVLLLG